MSFRIKLPPAKTTTGMFEDSEPTLRRKVSKRAVVSSDNEEEDVELPGSPPPVKRQRLDDDTHQDDFVNVDEDEDPDDRDGYDEDVRPHTISSSKPKRRIVKPKRYEEDEDEQPTPSTSRPPTTKNKRKKTKKADFTDEDTDDQFDPDAHDLAHDLGTLNDDNDDFEDEPRRVTKSRAKGGTTTRGQKGKGRETAQSSRKPKPARPSLNIPSTPPVGDDDDESYPSPAAPAPSTSQATTSKDSSSPPPVKKRKLPNIKKNKPNTTGTPITVAKKPTVTAKAPTTGIEQSDITKTLSLKSVPPPASADLDLRNNNVYAELFNRPGASNIRAGVSRREKEEQRRKELDKMRDEARAKRSAEGRDTFALQAQMDKILRFEERLKKSNSPALYPNILGAKMREVYDGEKKRRAREPPRTGSARPEQDLEEGEMA